MCIRDRRYNKNMQKASSNRITQTAHLTSRAVDYSARPNPLFYAPENARVSAYIPNNGDCGKNLKVESSRYIHSFCHLESKAVKVGQSVKRGQKLGKMGYTGRTIPAG